ncbi:MULTISPECIES: beta-propeller domain-containing protein [unclassified Pseudoalteromonas]|uniref:beta-propeller domain-containing protein n=1 Tax=unclassified Pseudoalteromonas TaxID=194690 RepID=UPI002096A526|nr:beta-propeller domain-containing protein [Pseudoalteromonas sp. XMcav2-N]MCO7190607.1 beta-propeller domain-containing protein [Pseudoalteromonas sp. XMcav2-N]
MLNSNQLKVTAAALSLALLSACGSGSDGNSSGQGSGNGGGQTPADKVPDLSTGEASAKKLRKASAGDFATYLKNGVYLSQGTSDASNIADGSEAGTSPTSGESPTFSTTNVQESAVDEGDRIKYDGDYLYIANTTDFQAAEGEHQQSVRILKRTEAGELTPLSSLITSRDYYVNQRLYLKEDNLAVVLSNEGGMFGVEPGIDGALSIAVMPYPAELGITLVRVDVKDPTQSNITHQLRFDGELVDSRVIGDSLYLVSKFTARFDGFERQGEDLNLTNYQKIIATDISELLPKVTDIKTGTQRLMVDPATCYVPEQASELNGYHQITSVTRVSLSDPNSLTSTCVASRTQGIYMSQKNLYLYGYYYDPEDVTFDDTTQTVMHQFSLTENAVTYSASGRVAGRLGSGNTNLRFSEHNDLLRVVTSRFTEENGMVHKLHILQRLGDNLALISQLPNDTRPTPIGKVSDNGLVEEDIYAVRFFGDKAYIVTFRQVDPLYVLDLSERNDPKITGALEIPGYSAYLHPVSDTLLVGIGQNVQDWFIDPVALNDDQIGAKVSLFDVSDIGAPALLQEKVFPGGYSPVEFDYHAFSYVKHSEDVFRMTLPVESWLTQDEGDNSVSWYIRSELAAFEVHSGETPKLQYMGSSVIEPQSDIELQGYVWSGDDRSVIHDDHIYYVHGNFVWSSLWQTPQVTTGPF